MYNYNMKKKPPIVFGNGDASNEEIKEVFPRISTKDERKREVKYVYCQEVLPIYQPGFVLEWGITNCGFGTTAFTTIENITFDIDDECMAKESIMEIITKMDNAFLDKDQVRLFIEKHSTKSGRDGLFDILDKWYSKNI